MGLAVRLPIGLLFSVTGVLLAGFGIFSDKGLYDRSLGLKVNLTWGIALLVFGVIMVRFGNRRGTLPLREQSSADSLGHSADGRP